MGKGLRPIQSFLPGRTRAPARASRRRFGMPTVAGLEPRVLLSPADLAPVPALPSIVTVSPGDPRVFVQDRRPDGSLAAPSALVINGVDWSPDSVGTPE